jgi:hypothetical protein
MTTEESNIHNVNVDTTTKEAVVFLMRTMETRDLRNLCIPSLTEKTGETK